MPIRFESRSPQGAAGFGLLEVLVATTLMGVVLVVLLQVLTSAMRAQEAVVGHMQALLVAEKVLQDNCALKSLEETTFQGREGAYDYKVQVSPQYELSNPQITQFIRCSLIQVTVTWLERGQAKSLLLETIRTAAQKKT